MVFTVKPIPVNHTKSVNRTIMRPGHIGRAAPGGDGGEFDHLHPFALRDGQNVADTRLFRPAQHMFSVAAQSMGFDHRDGGGTGAGKAEIDQQPVDPKRACPTPIRHRLSRSASLSNAPPARAGPVSTDGLGGVWAGLAAP